MRGGIVYRNLCLLLLFRFHILHFLRLTTRSTSSGRRS